MLSAQSEASNSATELNSSVRSAAVRWNHREARRWREGEDDFEPGEVEFAVRAKPLASSRASAIDTAAFVRVATPEGLLHFDIGLQLHIEGKLNASDQTLAEFGRRFAAPLLLGHLRGAVSTECLIMGWDTIVLPPALEDSVLELSDEAILGTASS